MNSVAPSQIHSASRPGPSSRRTFIRSSTLAGAALFTLPRFSIGKPGVSPNRKLNVACIGIGNRGWFAVSELLYHPHVNLVAVCDVNRDLVEETYRKADELGQKQVTTHSDLKRAPLFKDYREMLAKMGNQIDAVTVSTPDHHHYPAAMLALKHGKHVYVEKPLTHTVGEARALRAEAKKRGLVTQMGNQGRAGEGIRLTREWVKAGVLGNVGEVHGWSPPFPERYFKRPPSLPVAAEQPPPALDWDLWLGPAEARPYSSYYEPVRWRGWWDFGCGMLGDWACHTLDAPFWSLDLGSPSSVEAEVSEVNDQLAPDWAVVTYRFPARGSLPPVTLKWHEGTIKRPAAPASWDPKTPWPERGMMMIGDRNTLFSPNGRPDSPRLLPNAVMEEFKKNRPPASLPRVIGGPMKEWVDAILGTGPMPGSNFEYSVPLSEMVLLGVLAVRTGKRLEWDGAAGRITNDRSLNQFVKIRARKGWRI